MVKTSIFLLLLLIIIAAPHLEVSVPMKTFHYVGKRKSWTKARLYCKEKFTDLASFRGQEKDLLTELTIFNAWIGLYRDPGNKSVWRWTGERGDASSDTNWDEGPRYFDCGCLSHRNNRWRDMLCSYPLPFICYVDNLVLVKENKTWEEALEHCRAIGSDDPSQHNHHREHQYDLVSLQSDDDHRYTRDRIQKATTNEVWTALHFLAGEWVWVDGETLQYQNLPHCPARRRHCGTLPKDYSSTQFQIRDCMERRNFLCIKSPAKQPEE